VLRPINPTIANVNPRIFGVSVELFIEHGSVPPAPSPLLMMVSFGDDHIIYFRTLDDYQRLRADEHRPALHRHRRWLHWLGDRRGAVGQREKVTMIFPDAGIGARTFPRSLLLFLFDFCRRKGVDVLAGQSVSGFTSPSRVQKYGRIRLRGSRQVESRLDDGIDPFRQRRYAIHGTRSSFLPACPLMGRQWASAWLPGSFAGTDDHAQTAMTRSTRWSGVLPAP